MTTLAPGLIWALGFGLGILLNTNPLLASLSLLCTLSALYLIRRYVLSICLFFLFGFFVTLLSVQFPREAKSFGYAQFEPNKVQTKFRFGKLRTTYSGRLISLGQSAQLPAQLTLTKRLPCSGIWKFPAEMSWLGSKGYLRPLSLSFGPIKSGEIASILIEPKPSFFEQTFGLSFADFRDKVQSQALSMLKKSTLSKSSKEVLGALFLGERPSDLIRFYFQRCGLTHLLVVSGFHFALLAAVVMFVLLKIMRPSYAAWIALAILTLYYIFLGPSPSIQRAYIACALYAGSIGLRRSVRPEHALGLAALIELFNSPCSLFNIGFQLSYGLTLSILLLFPLIQKAFEAFKIKEISRWRTIQKFYIGFIDLLTLNITVSLVCIPMSLAYFQTFPLISLFYNLIIPPIGSLAMLLAVPAFLALGSPTLFSLCIYPASLLVQLILLLLKLVPMGLYYELIWIDPPQKVIAFVLIAAFCLLIRRKIIDPIAPIRVESALRWRS